MKNRGLYEKFTVIRNDGKSSKGEKHEKCYYFVLDLDHDRHSIPALRAYAESCKNDYPELSRDLLIAAKIISTVGSYSDKDTATSQIAVSLFSSHNSDLALTESEAMALAQFVKRSGFSDFRANAVDDSEAYLIGDAIVKVQRALAEHGYAPR